eukprot:TRINITY_DN43532_c0_g1_i2.p1 TRINITY_DN43532_c0_g1~~TRINITY_DN43532_c0_g1_i2.p1  ORF type:complete len:121 (+),score=31.31 TRINITY_DN43532_c0_g1_i2:137-499(+)
MCIRDRYMARPVVYLLVAVRCQKSSWAPWLISLGMDVLQLQLRMAAGVKGQQELEELTRRRSDMAYYLLRDPIYKRFTKPLMTLLHLRILNKIPLINAISDLCLGIFESMNSLHFYKAGS